MKYKNIFYCTNDPVKNIGSIRDYFIENTENLVTFHYQLGYSEGRSYVEKFKKGTLMYRREFSLYKGSNVLVRNLYYYLIFLYLLAFHVKRNCFIIIISPVFCFLSRIFSFAKRFKYVYWIEDYFPPSGGFYMKFYNFLVRYYSQRLKYVLFISPPIEKIYNIREKNKFRKLITLGINSLIEKKEIPSKKIKLGFIGIIRKEQGLDLVFEYLKLYDNLSLEIIGEGYDSNYYKSLSRKMGISEKIVFHGANFNPIEIAKNWDIALALYHESKSNFSTYSEPSKIKTYFSFGLPVISTKTTYFSKEIEEFNCGIIINETIDELSKAINKIVSKYHDYLKGVKSINRKYYYEKWYDRKLSFLKS